MPGNEGSQRARRTWTEAEIEAIIAADTEFPPITDDDLARALTAPKRTRSVSTIPPEVAPAPKRRRRA